ncbi:MAG: DNA-deoxyinosine glycosylase, partial [Spirochaetaceae bacterium]|nr:DNA-deoxyinosine glycosylase [Spirochaetaceae bacterium]
MRGLEPVAPAGARVLILGSFPSARSLERGEYYAHDRNHFWEVLALLAGEPRPESRGARIELLGRLGLAVWDV